MKPCRKQNYHPRRTAAPDERAPSAASGPTQAVLHRYVHPIRTVRPAPRPPMEELLAGVLDTLSRQSQQLDEVLRRLERDNSDTK